MLDELKIDTKQFEFPQKLIKYNNNKHMVQHFDDIQLYFDKVCDILINLKQEKSDGNDEHLQQLKYYSKNFYQKIHSQ